MHLGVRVHAHFVRWNKYSSIRFTRTGSILFNSCHEISGQYRGKRTRSAIRKMTGVDGTRFIPTERVQNTNWWTNKTHLQKVTKPMKCCTLRIVRKERRYFIRSSKIGQKHIRWNFVSQKRKGHMRNFLRDRQISIACCNSFNYSAHFLIQKYYSQARYVIVNSCCHQINSPLVTNKLN